MVWPIQIVTKSAQPQKIVQDLQDGSSAMGENYAENII